MLNYHFIIIYFYFLFVCHSINFFLGEEKGRKRLKVGNNSQFWILDFLFIIKIIKIVCVWVCIIIIMDNNGVIQLLWLLFVCVWIFSHLGWWNRKKKFSTKFSLSLSPYNTENWISHLPITILSLKQKNFASNSEHLAIQCSNFICSTLHHITSMIWLALNFLAKTMKSCQFVIYVIIIVKTNRLFF